MRGRTRESGVVLLVVLMFALLLASTITTFVRRSAVDSMISRNRDAMSRTEALARGGVRLATALLVEDVLRDQQGEGGERLDTPEERWAQVGKRPLDGGDGAELTIAIRDAGARLNLNAVFATTTDGSLSDRTEPFLMAFLEKVIDEMPVEPGEQVYDTRELAGHLIDWVDADDVRREGGLEDDYYQTQDPPYRAANRALLSVDELRLVEGFDGKLVEAIRPYVTVYPYSGTHGINLNTAPPHVLALLFYNDGVDDRLADEDLVQRILDIRDKGGLICQGQGREGCTPISDLVTNANTIHPPPAFFSEAFTVESRATLGDVSRTIEAVVDRSDPSDPRLLSWRVR